ncbi:CYTH domain-containing protein [Bacteriovoracaceae bacterium]|nr:CYTH domain-containing protein [Bacteriovoracaceae bacterium]
MRNFLLITIFLLSSSCFSEDLAEYHVFLCEENFESVKDKIVESKVKNIEVAYFDTQKLKLIKSGIIIRVRFRPDKKKSDLTLKIRKDSNDKITNSKKCEYDYYFSKNKYSCSWKQKISHQVAKTILHSKVNILDYLSQEQMELLKSITNTNNLKLNKFGNVKSQRYDIADGSQGEDWTVEYWPFENGRNLIELSFRHDTKDVNHTMQNLDNYLTRHKLKRCQKDISKTKYTLNYFLSPKN